MFMSDKNGKLFSGKINATALRAVGLSAVGLILILVFSLTQYSLMLHQSGSLKTLLRILQKDFLQLDEENKNAALYRQWADKIIYKRLNYEDANGQGYFSMPVNALDGEVKDDPTRPSRALMDIDNFEVNRINLALDFNVSFNLLNRTKGQKTLSGYFFVVAGNREVIPPIHEARPRAAVPHGLPADYKKGEAFNIRYMKPVSTRINQPYIGPKFNRVDLIAYSEDGKIIMKKGFYIERLLQENPFD